MGDGFGRSGGFKTSPSGGLHKGKVMLQENIISWVCELKPLPGDLEKENSNLLGRQSEEDK